jgi:hypothetical protein
MLLWFILLSVCSSVSRSFEEVRSRYLSLIKHQAMETYESGCILVTTDCDVSVDDIKDLGLIRLPNAGCCEYVIELSSP